MKKLLFLFALCSIFFYGAILAQLPGSTCALPVVVTDADLPFCATGEDTANYGDDYDGAAGACVTSTANYLGGDDYVIEYTPSANINVDIDLLNITATYAGVFVYDGCPDTGAICVGGDLNGPSTADLSIFALNLSAGRTYYIVVSTWPAPQSTGFDLCITENICDLANLTASIVCTGPDMFNVDVNFTGTDPDGSYTVSDDQGTVPLAGQDTSGVVGYGSYATANLPVTIYVESNSAMGCIDSVVVTAATACAPGADCSFPAIITSLPYIETNGMNGGTTCGFGDTYDNICGSLSSAGEDYVLSYTPSVTETIDISLTYLTALSNLDDFGIFVLDACPDASPNCIATATGNDSDVSTGPVLLTGGQQYFIIISGDDFPTCVIFDLVINSLVCDLNNVTANAVCTGPDMFNLDIDFTGTDANGSYTISDNQGTASLAGQDTSGVTAYGSYNLTDLPVTVYVESNSAAGCIDSVVVASVDCSCFNGASNDFCSGATPLTVGCNGPMSNVCATGSANDANEPTLPPCFNGGSLNSVWFSFIGNGGQTTIFPSAINPATMDTITNNYESDLEFAVYASADGTCGTLTEIDCSQDDVGDPGDSSFQPEYSFLSTAGTTYYVMVDGYGTTNLTGEFYMCFDQQMPPACDLNNVSLAGVCTSTTDYSIDVTFTGTSNSYTISDGVNSMMVTGAGTYNTATDLGWASYPADTTITITDNSQPLGSLGCSQTSSVTTPDCSCFGSVPSNDECATATSLTTGLSCTGTVGTTACSTESQPGCIGTANDDVWYSFVAATTAQDIEITNTGGTTDIVTEVFSGTCGSLTQISCQDTPNSPINLTGLTVGDTYYFRIYTWSSAATTTSDFEVCVIDIVCDLDNVDGTAVCLDGSNFGVDVSFTGTDPDGSYTISDNIGTAPLTMQDTTGFGGIPISYGSYATADLPVIIYVESNSAMGCIDSVVMMANPCDDICNTPTSTMEECVIVPDNYGGNLNCTTNVDLTALAVAGDCVGISVMGETETCCDSIFVAGTDINGIVQDYRFSGVIDTIVYLDPTQPFTVNFNSDGTVNRPNATSICWAIIPGCDLGCPFSLYVPGPISGGLYEAENDVHSDGAVNATDTVTFHADNYIDLLPNFDVPINTQFTANIQPCGTPPIPKPVNDDALLPVEKVEEKQKE